MLLVMFAVVAVSLAATVAIVMLNWKTPEEWFKAVIENPIPPSVRHIEQSGSLNAMGASSFALTFNIGPEDAKFLMARQLAERAREMNVSQPYYNVVRIDVKNVGGRTPDVYRQVLADATAKVGAVGEMYVFEHTNSGYQFDALVVNQDRTRMYYYSK